MLNAKSNQNNCIMVLNLNSCLEVGGRVLVHGNAGINRTSALVIAYVMATYGVSLKKAMDHVQSIRFTANPSDWFILQLKVQITISQFIL